MDRKPLFYALVRTFAGFSPSVCLSAIATWGLTMPRLQSVLHSTREIVEIHCLPFDLEHKISFCFLEKKSFSQVRLPLHKTEVLTELQRTSDSLSSWNEKRSLPAWHLPADQEHRLPVVPSVAPGAERPPSRLRGLNGPSLLLARFLHLPGVF